MGLWVAFLCLYAPLPRVNTGLAQRISLVTAQQGDFPRLKHTDDSTGALVELQGLWNRLVGKPTDTETDSIMDDALIEEDIEFVPLVLVVGATGRTGRIIVRKLLLRGFRVAVLVRSLSSQTLKLLGTGVSYSYGDMTDYVSLLDAMEEVDKVVFAASSTPTEAEAEREEIGLRNVLRAFQDTRTYMYGAAEATKLTLAKFRRDSDFDAWSIESSSDDVARRLADAGLAPKPTIAYWKRSDVHENAVFVGKIFDQYLGSAVASCNLGPTGLKFKDQVPEEDSEINAEDDLGSNFALGEYAGLLVKAKADGQTYTMIARTSLYESEGIEYQLNFDTQVEGFTHARLPFANFVPCKDGRPLPKEMRTPELDRYSLTGLALGFFPVRNNPAECDGSFYLSMNFIKAYRERDEPEFVYISRTGMESPPGDQADSTGKAATSVGSQVESMHEEAAFDANRAGHDASSAMASEEPSSTVEASSATDAAKTRGKHSCEASSSISDRCERALVSSGITYFVVRPALLDDMPGGVRRIVLTQEDVAAGGLVSREPMLRKLLCDLCWIHERVTLRVHFLNLPISLPATNVRIFPRCWRS